MCESLNRLNRRQQVRKCRAGRLDGIQVCQAPRAHGDLRAAGVAPRPFERPRAMRRLTTRPNVNAAASNGTTALILSAQKGHEPSVRALMEAGASMDAANNDNVTLLMAASMGGLLSTVAQLLPHSAVCQAFQLNKVKHHVPHRSGE